MGETDAGSRLPSRRSVSSEELEKVIHRAAELQFARGAVPDSLDESEVLQIAEEVGLEGRYVRQALAEMRASALVPGAPTDAGLAARLWGSAIVSASRVVPGEPGEVLDGLARYLRETESLRRVRDRAGIQVWEPAKDLVNVIRRSVNLSGKGYELARARSLDVAVEPLEEGRSLLTLTADLRNRRNEHVGGWLTGTLLAVPGLTALLVLGFEAPLALSLPAAGTTMVATGTFAIGKMFARRRERTTLALEGLLDRIERGESLASEKPTLRERISDLLEDDGGRSRP
ncbi:MAG: hypothetical protein ACE5HF_04995 [Gemmatimonadota bacterium]